MKNIGIDKSLSNNDLYEHKCIQNINKLYKRSGKCDNQQQLKYILDADMVSSSEGFTNNSPIYPMTSTPVNKPIDIKSLFLSTNILHAKNKIATCQVGFTKSNHKAIKAGTTSWALKPNPKGNSKVND